MSDWIDGGSGWFRRFTNLIGITYPEPVNLDKPIEIGEAVVSRVRIISTQQPNLSATRYYPTVQSYRMAMYNYNQLLANVILNNMPNFTGTADQVIKASSKCISSNYAMIEGEEYIEVVKQFYSFLETDFGFTKINETINGNAFYGMEFRDKERIISI